MRIRKEYQVIPTNAKLENGDSTSATNGYTAEYINDHSVVVSPTEPSGSARKKVWLRHSKNLLLTYDTYAENYGVTVTKNSDGSLTLSGTASGQVFIEICKMKIKANTNYTLSGSPEGSSSNTYFQYWDDSNLSGNRMDYGEGATISYTSETTVSIKLAIRSGQNVTGKTFYPMVVEGSTVLPYEPYVQDKTFILDNNVYKEYDTNKGDVLFQGTGNTSTITLNNAIENYKEIEIKYNLGDMREIKKYVVRNNAQYLISLYWGSGGNTISMSAKRLTISGRTVTVESNRTVEMEFKTTGNTLSGYNGDVSRITITEIIGYK